MRKQHPRFALTLVAAALLGIAGSALAAPVATVNGKPITEEAYNDYLDEQHKKKDQLDPAEKREIIDQLIARELVYQNALAKKVDKSKEIQDEFERVKREILIRTDVRKAMETRPVTEEEMRKEYEAQKTKLIQQEYKARHILVKEESEAKEIIKQLADGTEFAKLAKEKSTDRSSQEGGDLGWFGERQMVPEFMAGVKSLKKGEFSKSPVKSQFGYHVILLEDSRTAEPPPYDKVKPQIKQYLTQKHLGEYIEELRKKADVKVP